jgi:hypothetical protein
MILQNYCVPGGATILRGGTSTTSTSDYPDYPWENVLALTPSRPGRALPVVAATSPTRCVISFGANTRYIEAVALINVSSQNYYTSDYDSWTRRLKFGLRYYNNNYYTKIDYATSNIPTSTASDYRRRGYNIFFLFNSPFVASQLLIDIGLVDTVANWGASIGAVLAGRVYEFPNVVAPLGESFEGGAVVVGRPSGPQIMKTADRGARVYTFRSYFDTQDEKENVLAYFASGASGISGNTPLSYPRIDTPNAFIGPHMWGGLTAEWGFCTFGVMESMTSATMLGGGAFCDFVFKEKM